MVKVYSICILYRDTNQANILCTAFNLSSFNYFQRSSIQEFMTFFSKTVTERSHPANRQSIKEQEYMCHVYVRADNLSGVVITDFEYPPRVAHSMLTRILDAFTHSHPAVQNWPQLTDKSVNFPQLNVLLEKYQSPRDADPMTRIQEDLDETKIILRDSIGAVLERGEKLDDLVAKSEGLSMQSKAFYKTARKTNSCCTFG